MFYDFFAELLLLLFYFEYTIAVVDLFSTLIKLFMFAFYRGFRNIIDSLKLFLLFNHQIFYLVLFVILHLVTCVWLLLVFHLILFWMVLKFCNSCWMLILFWIGCTNVLRSLLNYKSRCIWIFTIALVEIGAVYNEWCTQTI